MIRRSDAHLVALPAIAVGACVLAWLILNPAAPITPVRLLIALCYGALYAVLASVEIPMGPGLAISAEPAAVALALILEGPAIAALGMLAGCLATTIRRRRSPFRIAFTLAQFVICLSVFAGIYRLLVGGVFGTTVPLRIIDGAWALGVRYVLAVLLGTAAFTVVNNLFMWSYLRLEGNTELDLGVLIRGELGGTPAFAGVAVPTAVAVAYLGWGLAALFALPAAGVLWSAFVLLRGRLVGNTFSVAERLTAFLVAVVGSIFIVITATVLITASRKGVEIASAGRVALGRSIADSIARSEQRGPNGHESIRRSLTTLLEGDSLLVYAALLSPHGADAPMVVMRSYGASIPAERTVVTALGNSPSTVRRELKGADGTPMRLYEVRVPIAGTASELRLAMNMLLIDESARNLALALGIASLALFIIALGGLRYYVRTELVVPLGLAEAALRDIAHGDADLARRLPVAGDREIAQLGEHFNRFISNLAALITAVAHTTSTVVDGAQELAACNEEVAASAADVASSMSLTVARLRHEQEETEALHVLTSRLTELNGEVADRTLQVRNETAEVVSVVARSSAQIGHAGQTLLDVREAVQSSARAGGELIAATREVRGLVAAISKIADQTNMLALNAAIEAARVGEHGRGFAVVADEIRKLADESAESARRAGELIWVVSGRADTLVTAMERGDERVAGAERIACASRDALSELTSAISRMDESVQHISEHVVMEREIVSSVETQVRSIEHLVRENASVAVQVGATTEAQTLSTEAMAVVSQRLAEEATLLQGLIGRFRIAEEVAGVRALPA